MSYSLKLDLLTHDIKIKNGHFVRVNGADEVRQRIKVALWHQFGEYFLNRESGVPYYDEILGSKMNQNILLNTIRQKVQIVPGVIQVLDIQVRRNVRNYLLDLKVLVRRGPNETSSSITLQGIELGG